MLFTMAGASLSLGKGHCYKLSVLTNYAAVLNQENAFSLGFATFLVAAVPPNTGHVPSAVI